MNEQIEKQIDQLLEEWKNLEFTHVAISAKNGKCFPVNKDLLHASGNGTGVSYIGARYVPSAGGDLFFELESKEVRAALFKSLNQGDKYETDSNLV